MFIFKKNRIRISAHSLISYGSGCLVTDLYRIISDLYQKYCVISHWKGAKKHSTRKKYQKKYIIK